MKCRVFSNTSTYPDREVKALIAIGTKGVNMGDVAIEVTGTKYAYSGRCFGARRILLRIGRPGRFPADNMTSSWRWRPCDEDEYERTRGTVLGQCNYRMVMTRAGVRCESRQRVEHPYGGIGSPLIVVADWREGIVSLAAHEARHVQQFQRGWRLSEVDCERFALAAVERYRKGRT